MATSFIGLVEFASDVANKGLAKLGGRRPTTACSRLAV